MRSPLILLFTATLFGITVPPTSGVWASSKSAIAPESAPLEVLPTEPATPAADPEPVTLEAPIPAPIAPPAAPATPQVVFDAPKPSAPPARVNAAVPEIVLESRSSGCQARSSELGQRRADLCNPTESHGYNGNRPPAPVNVRTLSPQEIRQLSVPSRGDRQMVFPLNIPAIVSSPFGDRVHPIHGGIRFHQGTDLAASAGTPVVAAFSGRVEVAAWVGGYGLMVVINHNNRYETRYAHLAELFVQEGQEIAQGTVIGLVGSTGHSTGPHLHFELWEQIKGEWYVLDPTPHLLLAMERLEQYLAQLTKPASPEAQPSV